MSKSTEFYRERKRLTIEKLGGKCTACNSLEDLEVDHIDNENRNPKTIHDFRNKQKPIYYLPIFEWQEELPKCQLLCKSCHDKKSGIEKRTGRPHSYSKYTHEKCRCTTCCQDASDYRMNRRRKNTENV